MLVNVDGRQTGKTTKLLTMALDKLEHDENLIIHLIGATYSLARLNYNRLIQMHNERQESCSFVKYYYGHKVISQVGNRPYNITERTIATSIESQSLSFRSIEYWRLNQYFIFDECRWKDVQYFIDRCKINTDNVALANSVEVDNGFNFTV